MTTETKVYKKAYSFDTFHSSIDVDIEQQKQRILNLVKNKNEGNTDSETQNLYNKIIHDLSSQDTQDVHFKITKYIADEASRIADNNLVRYILHRYRYDVFPITKELAKFPPSLQIEPASVCNFRCIFCYQADKNFSSKSSSHMGTMSFDLFKAVADQAKGNVEILSLASRGEPFVCKEIDKILEYCVGKFLCLKLNTNASLLNEKHCHAILAGGVNTVVFSADAAKEPLYSQLRVGGKLEKVLKNIHMFTEIKKKHYPQSKIITRVSGVKLQDDQDMESMVKVWGELVEQVCFVVYNRSNGDQNVYASPVNSIKKPCSELWRRMYVWYDGKVNPCETDYKSMLMLGRVQDHSILDIWLSELYNNFRKTHLNEQRAQLKPCCGCLVT